MSSSRAFQFLLGRSLICRSPHVLPEEWWPLQARLVLDAMTGCHRPLLSWMPLPTSGWLVHPQGLPMKLMRGLSVPHLMHAEQGKSVKFHTPVCPPQRYLGPELCIHFPGVHQNLPEPLMAPGFSTLSASGFFTFFFPSSLTVRARPFGHQAYCHSSGYYDSIEREKRTISSTPPTV